MIPSKAKLSSSKDYSVQRLNNLLAKRRYQENWTVQKEKQKQKSQIKQTNLISTSWEQADWLLMWNIILTIKKINDNGKDGY